MRRHADRGGTASKCIQKQRTDALKRKAAVQHAERIRGAKISRELRAVGEELVPRGAVYKLVSEEKDDSVKRKLRWQSGKGGKRCENGRDGSWIAKIAREHACARIECVGKR